MVWVLALLNKFFSNSIGCLYQATCIKTQHGHFLLFGEKRKKCDVENHSLALNNSKLIVNQNSGCMYIKSIAFLVGNESLFTFLLSV